MGLTYNDDKWRYSHKGGLLVFRAQGSTFKKL
jgi:hypothetical protein